MNRRKWRGLAGLCFCLFLLSACGSVPQTQADSQGNTEECQVQLENILTEYRIQWDVLAEQMELFYTALENGELKQQADYMAFQAAMERWCDEMEEYSLPEEVDACRYVSLMELAAATRTFLSKMETVQTEEAMEQAVDAYIQTAAPLLAELEEAESPQTESDWLVGTWKEAGENDLAIYCYQEDGTADFPDGTRYIWRRKGAEEPEDETVWRAVFPETGAETQIYYLSVDGKDIMKLAVEKQDGGALQVMLATLYAEEITAVRYEPVDQT